MTPSKSCLSVFIACSSRGRVDTEQPEAVHALDPSREHVEESEHGLEIRSTSTAWTANGPSRGFARSPIAERLQELRELDPDARHVHGRGGVLDPVGLADVVDALLSSDAVDDGDRLPS